VRWILMPRLLTIIVHAGHGLVTRLSLWVGALRALKHVNDLVLVNLASDSSGDPNTN
jgi:hypothetical protein